MPALKNGIKSTLRTPGKTALFLAILTVISALLTVSFSVFAAVRGYINDCDEYYHTIAELEYVGRDYPDPFVYDGAVSEAVEENSAVLEKLLNHDAVISFEPAAAFVAVSDSMHRWDDEVYDPDAAVFEISVVSWDDLQSVYNVLVLRTLYSRKDYTNKLLVLSAPAESDGERSLEVGKKYFVAGRLFKGKTMLPWFSPAPMTYTENGEKVSVDAPVLSEELGENNDFEKLAREISFRNDSVRVTYTSSIEDLYIFHQQVSKLSSGRFFTEEEYETNARVCIISERIAGMMKLSAGDTVELEVYGSDSDIYSVSSLYKRDGGKYEIVGIQTETQAFPYRVFMPAKDASSTGILNVNGYTLGQFRLKNDKAASFIEASAELFEKGFRVNVYDQGYSAATEPMRELLLISAVFLAVCLLLAFSALALQSHLFVSRQREAALTMHALGSGKAHIFAYFLSSSTLLALLASVFGGIIGRLLEGRVFGLLKDYASQFSGVDTRFSSGSVALTRTLSFEPTSEVFVYIAAALAVVIGSLLLTLAFSAAALKNRRTSRKIKKKRAKMRAAHTSILSGSFKYSLLSVRRGGLRTLAVIVMGAVAAVFFGRLVFSLEGYGKQLESYRDNAKITGYATDREGHRISGLLLRSDPMVKLYLTGLIEDVCVSSSLGHIAFTGQVGEKTVDFVWPRSAFAYEAAFNKLCSGPKWTAVSSVKESPLFHYTESGSVEWLEGWGEEDFTRTEMKTIKWDYWEDGEHIENESEYRVGPSVCAVPKDLMEEYGIKLGDTLDAVMAHYVHGTERLDPISDLLVVACYTSPMKSTEVFSPITYSPVGGYDYEEDYEAEGGYTDYAWWMREGREAAEKLGLEYERTYSSFTFRLSDNSRLDELRDALESSGYASVRSNDRAKSPAVIEDEVFLNTVHSMERQIQYVSVLYAALCVLAGIIGFVLAWLMTLSRRKEIAVMRALGTPPVRILANFLFEQMLLILSGLGTGSVLPLVFGSSPDKNALLLAAAFFAVWSLSSFICLTVSLLKRSYAALTEPE